MRVFKSRASRARARQKLLKDNRVWAGVGARVTFRAEVMPGRDPVQRTFTVERIVASGRVELTGLSGEHAQTEFESEKGAHVASTSSAGKLKDTTPERSGQGSAKNEA
jgi:hypothetical protein